MENRNINSFRGPAQQPGQIDLVEVALILLKRWWIILISALICAVTFFTISFQNYVPSYLAQVTMFVNSGTLSIGQTISISSLNSSTSLVPVYSEILDTHLVLDKVGERMASQGYAGYDYESLSKVVTSTNLNDTPIVVISVTDSDPDRAMLIANTIADVLPDTIQTIIDGTSARIIDSSKSAEKQSSGIVRNTIIAAFLGIIVSAGFIVVLEYLMNDRIMDVKWLEENYGDLPLMGKVPSYETEANGKGLAYYGYGYSHNGAKKVKENKKDGKKKES